MTKNVRVCTSTLTYAGMAKFGSRGEFITHWDDGDIDTFYVFYRKGSSPFTGIKNGPLAQTVRAADS